MLLERLASSLPALPALFPQRTAWAFGPWNPPLRPSWPPGLLSHRRRRQPGHGCALRSAHADGVDELGCDRRVARALGVAHHIASGVCSVAQTVPLSHSCGYAGFDGSCVQRNSYGRTGSLWSLDVWVVVRCTLWATAQNTHSQCTASALVATHWSCQRPEAATATDPTHTWGTVVGRCGGWRFLWAWADRQASCLRWASGQWLWYSGASVSSPQNHSSDQHMPRCVACGGYRTLMPSGTVRRVSVLPPAVTSEVPSRSYPGVVGLALAECNTVLDST